MSDTAMKDASTITSKRRARSSSGSSSSSSSSSSEQIDFINVSFDFTSPSDIDFHSLRRQLQQLFYTYAAVDEQLNLSAVADHVIEVAKTGQVGTVVKVDQEDESDPYAFVSLVELKAASAASTTLHRFFSARLLSKSSSTSPSTGAQAISAILSVNRPSDRPYLVLHERMVNLPAQIATPLYRILVEEIEAQLQQKPTHLLFFSRIFSAAAFSSDEESDVEEGRGNAPTTKQQQKRKKRRTRQTNGQGASAADMLRQMQAGSTAASGGSAESARSKTSTNAAAAAAAADQGDYHAFHPEDELILKHASASHIFRFPPPKDAADTYEAPMFGRLALVEYSKTPALLKDLEQAFGQS